MEEVNNKEFLKVGIAGYGIVGKRRRSYIDIHPNLRTVAVCDQKIDQLGVKSDGVKYFNNYKQLLAEPIDVLFVSLPNYLASEVTIAGLKRKMHVFCEKPPGRNVKDIENVLKVKESCPNVLLKYGFNHRYHKSVCEALKLVRAGVLGEVINLRGVYGKSRVVPFIGNWRSDRKCAGGGILLDQGIHMVDLMRLFCDEIVEVKSFISNQFWKHDVEDNAYVLMRDKKGKVAILHSSATQWQHCFSLVIALSEGYLELQGILSGTKSYGEEKLIIGRRSHTSNTGTEKEEVITYLEDHSWRDEVNEFADAIINKGIVESGTVEDAYQTMKLVYDIYCADPDWRKIYDL